MVKGRKLVIKTIVEFSIAVTAIIIFSPVFVLMYIAVKVTSKGPAIYKQERIGLQGKPFYIYKFRSMKVDAESSTGPIFSGANDSRVTIIGNFIRSSKLDELPQLVNIVLGHMSFVGPRPERAFFTEKYTSKIPRYAERFSVKPGITGLAQINFSSHDDVESKIYYDLEYIANHSISLDVTILFKTAHIVVEGAITMLSRMIRIQFNKICHTWHKIMLESLTSEPQSSKYREYHAKRMNYFLSRMYE